MMQKKAKAIVIARNLTKQEALKIEKVYQQKNISVSIFLTDIQFLPSSIELASVEILQEEDKNEINRSVFREILAFGEIEIGDQKLTDLFSFERMSLWHYQKMRTYFFVRNGFYEINKIVKLNDDYQKIEVYTDNIAWRHFPFDSSSFKVLMKSNAKEETINYASMIKYLLFFQMRIFFAFFQIRKLRKVKHIIIDHSIKQTVLAMDSLQPKQANYNLEYLFEGMNEDFIILDEKEIPKLKGKSKFFQLDFSFTTKRKTLFSELVVYQGIISRKLRSETSKISKKVQVYYAQIAELNLNPTQRFILNYFQSLHPTTTFFIFKYLAYRKFFAKYPKLKTLTTIDENGARIKTILDAAKQNRLRTFGIQHGAIFDLHPSYMFTAYDKHRDLVPDRTFVWGDYWKRLLIDKGNYDAEKLIVTGQVRTDIIPKLIATKPHDSQLNPDRKRIFLFASQYQRDESQRKQIALDVFQSVKNFDDILLLIKLHPSEKNEMDYYHHLAKSVECSNYKLIYHYDLYKLLAMSDIVGTSFSTVGAEAIYFGKPLIIIDPLKQDQQGYFKQGVAFQVCNQRELENTLSGIIAGTHRLDKQKYKAFVKEYVYVIDGESSVRIIEEICSDSYFREAF